MQLRNLVFSDFSDRQLWMENSMEEETKNLIPNCTRTAQNEKITWILISTGCEGEEKISWFPRQI